MNSRLLLAVIASASASFAGAARAASVVDWTYTVAASVFASGQMTLSDPNGVFGDSVLSISGTFDGQPITGLAPNPNAPYYVTNSTGFVPYDNNIDPSSSSLDYFGIEFDVGSSEYNLAGRYAAPFSYVADGSASSLYTDENVFVNSGTLSVYSPLQTESPGAGGDPPIAALEPASWVLLLVGSAMLGVPLRAARRKARLGV